MIMNKSLSLLMVKALSLKTRVALLGAPMGNQNAAGPHDGIPGNGGQSVPDGKKGFAEVKKVLKDNMYDDVSHDKEGNVVVRRSFFYTGGKTAKDFQDKVQAVLDKAGVKPSSITSGEVYKAFKGGASIRNQSHWFVKIKP